MKRIRIMGLCLVAAFAMSAVATGTANANCVMCTVDVTPTGPHTSVGGGYSAPGMNGDSDFHCTSVHDFSDGGTGNGFPGTYYVPQGCGFGLANVPCTSPEHSVGEVITEALFLHVAFINGTAGTVGVEEIPEGKESTFAKFTCGDKTITLRGGVVGSITPVNKPVTSEEHFTLTFNQTKGKQQFTKLEGGGKIGLELSENGGKYRKVTLSNTEQLTPSQTTEIIAVGPAPSTKTYLALGDSLAFGYTQEKFNNNFPAEPPSAFEEGYAHFFAKHVRGDSNFFGENLHGLVETNNGCPGETTDSFIGNGPVGAGLGSPPVSPCGYHKAGFPLHHEYGAGQSQLENGLQVLAENAGKVKAVTLNIGANDELASVHKCEKEVKEEFEKTGKSIYGATPSEAVTGCIGFHAKETFEHIIKNIGKIVFAIDKGSLFGGVNYTGPIVLLGFYNPDSFELPGSDTLQKALNTAIEATFFPPSCTTNCVPNMTYANPFSKINVKNPVIEKQKIEKYTEMCNPAVQVPIPGTPDPGCEGDIHPTVEGYKLLANVLNTSYKLNPAPH